VFNCGGARKDAAWGDFERRAGVRSLLIRGSSEEEERKNIFEARGKGILDQSSQFEVTSECLDLVPTT
jgi:hypothetical protein